MESTFMQEKLASNEAHSKQLEEQNQFLTEMSASMAALLSNTDDTNPQAYQNNMKELVANCNKHSANLIDAQAPALGSVRIEAPVQVAPIDNIPISASTPLHQVTLFQPGDLRAYVGNLGDISPLKLLAQMRTQESIEV